MKKFFKELFESDDPMEVAGFFALSSLGFILLSLSFWIIRVATVCPCQ